MCNGGDFGNALSAEVIVDIGTLAVELGHKVFGCVIEVVAIANLLYHVNILRRWNRDKGPPLTT